jgi:putative hemolysin
MNTTLQLFLILVAMVGAAFFAGIETGIISINRLRLRHMVRHKVPRASVLQFFLQNPDRLFGTTLVGTNICHIIASVLVADLGARLGGAVGTAVAAFVLALVVLFFCEYVPKAWFQSRPTHRTLPFAPLLKWCGTILFPIGWAFTTPLKRLIPAPREVTGKEQPSVTRDELLYLAREGAEAGELTRDEHRMIYGVMELRGKNCGQVMIPRERFVQVQHDTPAADVLKLARSTDVNRFPVFDSARNAFVGILHIYDILADANPGAKVARDYMKPVQLVSHETHADHVLPRMRVTRQPMVLVTNDRYEVVGLVTLADVLEEVVGEL